MSSAFNVCELPTVKVKMSSIKPPKIAAGERNFSKSIAQEIADSIQAKGLLYPPVLRDLGTEGGATPYEIVCGIHRVYSMGSILKWDEIPAKVIKCDADDARMIKIIENCARNSLTKEQFFSQVSEWKALHEKKNKPGAAGGKASAKAKAKKSVATAPAVAAGGDAATDGAAAEASADSPEGAEPEAVSAEPVPEKTSFLDMISAAMGGVGKRTAARVVRIAKALDKLDEDERKIVFPADDGKHATQGDLEGLASLPEELRSQAIKLVGSGMEWGRALKETAKKVVKPADPTKPKSMEDLTDAEWVDAACATVKTRVKKTQPLTSDCLVFRKWAKLRKKIQAQVEEMLTEAAAAGKTGPAFRSILNAFRMKHANDWMACADCQGTGQGVKPDADGKPTHCKPCMGAGYKVQVEPL